MIKNVEESYYYISKRAFTLTKGERLQICLYTYALLIALSHFVDNTDNLYAKSRQVVEQFQFDDKVATVFSDMIKRSVPGYPLMLDALGVIAEKYIQDNSLIYDLGCSLGASTLAIRQNIQAENCRIIAIDNAQAMIERCQQVIYKDQSPSSVEVVKNNIQTLRFEPSDFICMNLTLQFIPQAEREALINRMASALNPNGILFLSEKIAFDNDDEQNTLTHLHHQFKHHQGYTHLEIAQKRQAIENILIPDTLAAHKTRLIKAGFKQVIVAFQCFNFCSLIAFK